MQQPAFRRLLPEVFEEEEVMANKPEWRLQAEPRTITGKKVKRIREKGLVPGAVSGREGTLLIQFPLKGNERVVGHAGLINLEVPGSEEQQVLIKQIERSAVNREILHVDFTTVSADQKVNVEVPLLFLNSAPVEQTHNGIVMRQLETLHITCLPRYLPEAIPIDMAQFTELRQTLTVGDLPELEGVTIQNPPEAIIISIAAPQLEEEPEVAAAEGISAEEAAEETAEGTAELAEGAS